MPHSSQNHQSTSSDIKKSTTFSFFDNIVKRLGSQRPKQRDGASKHKKSLTTTFLDLNNPDRGGEGQLREISKVFSKEGDAITLTVPNSMGRQRSAHAETTRPGFFTNASNVNLHNTVMNLNYHDHERGESLHEEIRSLSLTTISNGIP